MGRRAFLGAVLGLAAASGAVAPARPAGAEPAPRLVHPADRLLLERAERVGRNVSSRHVSPEGLLAYEHRPNASPAELSADTLRKADVAIWTGCYAASVACRWHVTRDPAALAEARRVAAGLDLLSRATGVPGAISRSVGVPLPGEPRAKGVRPSPLGGGLHYRGDPSRDSLTGVVLGWSCLARFVDDPEVKAYAASNLSRIAKRLFHRGMNLRDVDGDVTKYGRLDHRVGPLSLVENGMHAAIGLACVVAASVHSGDPDLRRAVRHLEKEGWDDAVDALHTWIGEPVTSASNLNMVHLACLTLALDARGRAQRNALAALREMRRKTAGWRNGGYLACALLAGQQVDRDRSVPELREALLTMGADEVEWVGAGRIERDEPVPLALRPVSVWQWKQSPFVMEVGRERARKSATRTFTRADYLFAYWLARAAGELDPG
jgi:hypothetical protein